MKLAPFLLALSLTIPALAQDLKFYRLDFAIKELDEAKVVSVKRYSTLISTDERENGASIRAGSKVPYQVTTPAGMQHNFVDVGVNIDCQKIKESGSQLAVQVNAEISSVPATDGPINAVPLIRQNRWRSLATVEIGKATTLYSSDDLNSTRKLQLELTATLVK